MIKHIITFTSTIIVLFASTVLYSQTDKGTFSTGGSSMINIGTTTNTTGSDTNNEAEIKRFHINLKPNFSVACIDGFFLGTGIPIDYGRVKNGISKQSSFESGVHPFLKYYLGTGKIKPFLKLSVGAGITFNKSELETIIELPDNTSTSTSMSSNSNSVYYGCGGETGIAIFISEDIALDVSIAHTRKRARIQNDDAFIKNETTNDLHKFKSTGLSIGFNLFF